MAQATIARYKVSIRFACMCLGISETCYRYQPKLSSENAVIADWLLRLTQTHKRWGFGLCFLYLRNIKGFHWNHKRVYRIYRELELNLRIKPRRRIQRNRPDALSVPAAPNQVWSMGFMSDRLANGRKLRTFNVMDDYNREGLAIEVDQSLPSTRVIRALEQVIEWRGDNELPSLSTNFEPKRFPASLLEALHYVHHSRLKKSAYHSVQRSRLTGLNELNTALLINNHGRRTLSIGSFSRPNGRKSYVPWLNS